MPLHFIRSQDIKVSAFWDHLLSNSIISDVGDELINKEIAELRADNLLVPNWHIFSNKLLNLEGRWLPDVESRDLWKVLH